MEHDRPLADIPTHYLAHAKRGCRKLYVLLMRDARIRELTMDEARAFGMLSLLYAEIEIELGRRA